MKHLLTGILIFATVILIICTMELADELGHWELMALGFASCVAITGTLGAAIAFNLEDN